NETWDVNGRKQCDDVLRMVYLATKSADDTRPCIDTSGNFHVQTDIFDVHDYNQDVASFSANYAPFGEGGELYDRFKNRQTYDGKMPVFISEYGGIGWTTDPSGWGYGNNPKTPEEFIDRFCGLTAAILNNPNIMGLCYTQLTNVEQEQNGLYTYAREPKFDPAIFRAVLTQKAAIED
ncbi:MAG: beta-galactosidase, partial [Firmicutes bacterium]|nr:beta-galactosidase [Bacillota bacterium]